MVLSLGTSVFYKRYEKKKRIILAFFTNFNEINVVTYSRSLFEHLQILAAFDREE